MNPFYLSDIVSENRLNSASVLTRITKMHHLDSLRKGLDAWDYQWQINCLLRKALAVSCRSNLISNLGDQIDATHTKFDKRARLETQPLLKNLEFVQPKINQPLTDWYEQKTGCRSIRGVIRTKIQKIPLETKKLVKRKASNVVLGKCSKVVIASAGRSGSTVLFQAVRKGYRSWLCSGQLSSLKSKFYLRIMAHSADRLDDIHRWGSPVIKTHDLPTALDYKLTKYLFVFADPVSVIDSVIRQTRLQGINWLDNHIYHLRGLGSFSDIYEKDVLNYASQLQQWTREASLNNKIFVIPYSHLWEWEHGIKDFLGFSIQLPEKRERKVELDEAVIKKDLLSNLLKEYDKAKNFAFENFKLRVTGVATQAS